MIDILYVNIGIPLLVIMNIANIAPHDVPDANHKDVELDGEGVEEASNTKEALRDAVLTVAQHQYENKFCWLKESLVK